MSKVNIKFNCDNPKEDEIKVPIIYTYSNYDSLYALIKDEGEEEKPYRVICLDNGYMQAGCNYSSISEFMDSRKGAILVDIDILVKTK